MASLREYIVAHCGFWIQKDQNKNASKWTTAIDASGDFAKDLTKWFVKWISNSTDSTFSDKHPVNDDKCTFLEVRPTVLDEAIKSMKPTSFGRAQPPVRKTHPIPISRVQPRANSLIVKLPVLPRQDSAASS
jgi:hypothetical protein